MAKREEGQAIESRENATPWWLNCGLTICGLGFDWYCAFEWFSGRYALYSTPVLRELSLIVVLCATVALLVVYCGKAKLREAPQIFFILSFALFGFMFLSMAGH